MQLVETTGDKKHIIWDWNGTVLDDVQHAVKTMNKLLSEQDLELINSDKYKSIFEFPVRKYYDKLGFDYSKRSFEDLCHDFVDGFMDGISDCTPFLEIENTLVQIKREGKVQSVLSATDQENLDKMIKHFCYEDYFDFVYGIDNKFAASKVVRGKELIEKSKMDLKETVLIGDTLHDLEVGDELGIDVILITHGHQCENILKKHHHTVLTII